jgi:mRNA interferase MazF
MADIPARGDVIWLTFNPQAGHEQAGRQPALVLSWQSYLHCWENKYHGW